MPFYVVMARLVRATHDLRRAGAHRAATGLSADPVSVDGPPNRAMTIWREASPSLQIDSL